jgi:hypothetical protein
MSGLKKRLGMTARKEGKVSDAPTPRTDAQEFIPVHECGHFPPYPTVSSGFARQLERELAEAQDRIDDLTSTGIHSCGSECKRPNCVLRRELAEARESEASEARWAAQYKRQRDALAGVVLDIRAGYGGQVVDADCPCEDCKFLAKLNSALATLEESPPTTP